MLYKGMKAVYTENYTKYINTIVGKMQNFKSLNCVI